MKNHDQPGGGPDSPKPGSQMSRKVGLREQRMLKSRERKLKSVWTGFGVFGLIGWSVVLPTLLGTAIGHWLDTTYPGHRSWTLIFLVAGLSIGCLNAWRWIWNEHREITRQNEQPEDSHHD